jgi:membrane protein implicated in regulation of membrane protease activity
MESLYWLIAFIVLLAIEIMTVSLTTIWFAGGCIVAFIAALIGAEFELQISLFVVVSLVLLFFTRPAAARYLNNRTTKTNVEGLIGKKARITEKVDNILGTGAAVINGQMWTARSTDDAVEIEKDRVVRIVSVSGVKLIVEKMEEEA